MKIISGGQSGVDRAALDFCIENNLLCGGWCPKGRLAEDGGILDIYPLKETRTSNYEERTFLNIKDSDGTLVFYYNLRDAGTDYTLELLNKNKKPYFQVDLALTFDVRIIKNWIVNNEIEILNIAGPRESNSPGIYMKVKAVLGNILSVVT